MSARFDAVYIHIGHGKTGSSFLQSALACSLDALSGHGFVYPISEATAETARKGHVTGGNLRGQSGNFAELVASLPESSGQKLLISGESFFPYLERNGQEFLEEYRQACPGVPLHILCYLRDPVDHAVSLYHQKVKRAAYTGTLARSLTIYQLPARTVRVLSALQAEDIAVTVLNYSRHSKDLLGSLQRWLELPDGVLNAPSTGRINRSLNNAELELQRLMNREVGRKAARFISNPLCNELPDVRSEAPPLPQEALEAFLSRMQEEISSPAYQALVPQSECPHVGVPADYADRFSSEAGALTFTPEQLKVVAKALGQVMQSADNAKGGPAQRASGGGKSGSGKGRGAGNRRSRPGPGRRAGE